MENLKTSIGLTEIVYPVFKLGLNRPITDDGVVYYLHTKQNEDGEPQHSIRVVDDKNIDKPTLSQRRLQLAVDKAPLFRISKAIYFLGDLIKIAKANIWFIDASGRVFTYQKQSVAKLKIYPIKLLRPIRTGGVIVEVEGILTRFKALYMPGPEMQYAGVLHLKQTLILYGFYSEQHDESWRKV